MDVIKEFPTRSRDMSSIGNWDDIIEDAQEECFVGREQEVDFFVNTSIVLLLVISSSTFVARVVWVNLLYSIASERLQKVLVPY